MKLVNIELHFFSKSVWNITQNDAITIMQRFIDLNLFPAQRKERTSKGNLVDIFAFNNQNEGLSLILGTERITVTKSITPVGEGSLSIDALDTKLQEVTSYAYNLLERLYSMKDPITFNRLATVVKIVDVDNVEQLLRTFADNQLSNCPWNISSLKELNIRTCSEETLPNTEQVNSIVNINHAMLDANIDGALSTQECITFELDINTLPEHKEHRFDLTKSNDTHNEINTSTLALRDSIKTLL